MSVLTMGTEKVTLKKGSEKATHLPSSFVKGFLGTSGLGGGVGGGALSRVTAPSAREVLARAQTSRREMRVSYAEVPNTGGSGQKRLRSEEGWVSGPTQGLGISTGSSSSQWTSSHLLYFRGSQQSSVFFILFFFFLNKGPPCSLGCCLCPLICKVLASLSLAASSTCSFLSLGIHAAEPWITL